tara:strand:+ start:5951 stop:6544 length:594 start_codon:yes stop_codon:yes gene_type:complete
MLKACSFAVSLLLIVSAQASASLLSGGLNVDNGYLAYLSTDKQTQGVQISSGNNWASTYSFSGVNLDAGQDYFLHIFAYDQGWIAGFLGEFNLTGTDHVFSNGQTNLTTNTTDWDVSTIGWSDYQAASSLGNNGVWPWYNRPAVSSSAEWIWSDDAYNDNYTYFTTAISSASVPEPSSLFLLGLGFVGLMLVRKKIK